VEKAVYEGMAFEAWAQSKAILSPFQRKELVRRTNISVCSVKKESEMQALLYPPVGGETI
jgi:hypothetical protein